MSFHVSIYRVALLVVPLFPLQMHVAMPVGVVLLARVCW